MSNREQILLDICRPIPIPILCKAIAQRSEITFITLLKDSEFGDLKERQFLAHGNNPEEVISLVNVSMNELKSDMQTQDLSDDYDLSRN